MIRQCPKCGLYVSSKEKQCFDCGYMFPRETINNSQKDSKKLQQPKRKKTRRTNEKDDAKRMATKYRRPNSGDKAERKTGTIYRILCVILALVIIVMWNALSGMEKEYKKLTSKYEELDAMLKSEKSENESLEEENQSLEQELEEAKSEIKSLEADLHSSDAETEQTAFASSAPSNNTNTDSSEKSEASKKGKELTDKINSLLDGSYNDANPTKDEYKALCQTISYNDILRNPDDYKGSYAVVSGKVDQIIEGWFGSYSIFIIDGNGNKWGCTYSYGDGESHVLKGDYVTAYGQCKGTDTSRTVLGEQVTMPRVDLEYID